MERSSSLTCQLLSEQLLLETETRPLLPNMAERGPWRFPAAYAYPKLKRPCFITKCCFLSRVLPPIRDQELMFL